MRTLDKQETLQHLISEFQNELIQKLLDLEAINHSIKAFSLIHLHGVAIGIEDCNLFDDLGNWNKRARVDENNSPFEFDQLCERINDILYPNILHEDDVLSFKEKMILSALVYEIQTKLLESQLSGIHWKNPQAINELQTIRALLFEAADEAIKYALPYLKTYLLTAELNRKLTYPKQALQLNKDKAQPQPKHQAFTFGFFSALIDTMCHSEEKHNLVNF